MTSDRVCVYNDPPAPSSRYALLLPKPAQLLQEALLNVPAIIGSQDAMHLDFFRHYTIKELPGSELEFPWSGVLLSAGIGEPVCLSMAALGSMHRAQSGASPVVLSGMRSCSEPYELYEKAVVALRKYIDRTPEVGLAVASETALITIMLLFCFEVLCGSDHNAGKHLTAAFAILSKLQGHFQHGTVAPWALVLKPSDPGRTDVVLQFFLRLASDWLVSGDSYYGGCDTPLKAICKDSMPASFQSIRDASIHLDALCSEAYMHEEYLFDKADQTVNLQPEAHVLLSHDCAKDCFIMAKSRSLDLGDESTFHEDVNNTIRALGQWRSAFSSLLALQPRATPVLLLEIQYLQAWLVLCTVNDFDSTLCDELEQYFRRIVEIAEAYMFRDSSFMNEKAQPKFKLRVLSDIGNNLASTVCMVIERCRNSEIRQRAITLLWKFDLKGIFDTPYLVAYYQHLITLEEVRSRALSPATNGALMGEDVPLQARVLEALMCHCGSEEEGEEFYRQDHGRMVYAVRNCNTGALEMGQSTFQVCRDR